ncbi:hypothetical protein [Nitrospirillum sp. BR 11163]|uniref:hypothetical protein n=1 Tax=Nitrospirillum sp. BR 11163 TaxID=3104323 RepID=UPI002AFE86F5|nr:hypothetical protein [Nitrospirillum sp. BR 11163]MEA1674087.1 hypothetical protein [Nitrospirillum sp. BR 11163]
MTKGEFAAFVNRTPAAVSQWIARGKLTDDALIGIGRTARINVPVAMRQLGSNLDLGQQLRQDAPIDAPPTSLFDIPSSPREPGVSKPRGAGKDDPVKARYDAASAEHKEQQVALGRIQLAKEAGRWVDREKTEMSFGRQIAGLMTELDNHHQAIVDTLVEELGIDRAKVRILVQKAWRKTRNTLAEALERQAMKMPELVEAP